MHNPTDRETEHAKLLTCNCRQVLAYLFRDDDDDALCVVLQVWVAVTDEQYRAVVRTQDDESAVLFFHGLDDSTIPGVIDHLGITTEIEALEEAMGQ